jgi:hypothetical protein
MIKQRSIFSFVARLASMPVPYHGSRWRYILGRSVFSIRQMFKGWKAGVERDPELLKLSKRYRDAISARDWHATLDAARPIALIAEQNKNIALMSEMARALGRLEDYERSSQLLLGAYQLRHRNRTSNWNGEDISDKILLLELTEDSKQSLGRVLRYAQLIGHAVIRAKRCLVIVEDRLVPLLKRTFPRAEIFAASDDDSSLRDHIDKFAGFAQLASIFARSAEQIERGFIPLRADESLRRSFRSAYQTADNLPLIGLSWGSKSYNKDVPDLRDWSAFIRRTRAQFVSLQYGNVEADLSRLDHDVRARVIHDLSVDQLKDMDRFATQISALDAVISISNTAAHCAGALGVPSIFLIDDDFHTNWPVFSDRLPWYPYGHVMLKRGRTWDSVLEDAGQQLTKILAARGTRPR